MFGQKRNRIGLGGIALAFAGGLAAGAAVALLYAPKPGKKTREELGADIAKFTRKARKQVDKGVEQMTEGIKEAGEAIEGVLKKLA